MAHDSIDIALGAPLGRKTQLVVTPEEVRYGDHAVVLERVQYVACLAHTMSRSMAGLVSVRMSSGFQCWLADDRDQVAISATAGRVRSQESRLAEVRACLEGLLFDSLVPRLTDAALAHFRQGEAVTVGGREALTPAVNQGSALQRNRRARSASTVRLSQAGVELLGEQKTKSTWEWAQVRGVTVHQGQVQLVPAEGKPVPLLPLGYSNAVLLPSLIDAILAPRPGAQPA